MNLNDRTLQKIKLHYTEEYQKTLSKLKELEEILSELGAVKVSYDSEVGQFLDTSASVEINDDPHREKEVIPEKRSYKKRAKKRGRKSVWGDFILKRLKSIQKPLSYDDLTNHAIVIMKLDRSEFNNVRKSLVSAVFNLRKKQDKVSTVAKKGSRDKYVLLKQWVDASNKMLPEFKDKL